MGGNYGWLEVEVFFRLDRLLGRLSLVAIA